MEIPNQKQIIAGVVTALILFSGSYYYRSAHAGDATSDLELRNGVGYTPLMQAIVNSNFPEVQRLIAAGADVNARTTDRYGMPVLVLAVFNGNKGFVAELVDLLLEKGARTATRDNAGNIALHQLPNVTQLDAKKRIIDTLLKYNAPINEQNDDGDTPLHLLARAQQFEAGQYMIEQYGTMIDFNIKNKLGETVTDCLAYSLLKDVLDAYHARNGQMFGYGDSKKRDTFGRTGLMLAIMRNDEPFATEQLRDANADPNAQESNRSGNRPLHIAVMRGFNVQPYVELLLKYQADPTLTNNAGKRPIDYIDAITDESERGRIQQLLEKQ